jgi:hypothetical protein
MERREFLTSSLAASALALAKESSAQSVAPTPSGKPREYYEIRKYHLAGGLYMKSSRFHGCPIHAALSHEWVPLAEGCGSTSGCS